MVINSEVHSAVIKCPLLYNYGGTKGLLFAALCQLVPWTRDEDARLGLLNIGVPKSSQSTNVSQIRQAQKTSSELFKTHDQKGCLLKMIKDHAEMTGAYSQKISAERNSIYKGLCMSSAGVPSALNCEP